MVVIDDQTSMVDVLLQLLPVLRPRIVRPVHALPRRHGLVDARCSTASARGKGRLEDLDLLLEIGDSIGIIPGTTICGLADGAAWPIKNAIKKFRGEFEEYINEPASDRSRRPTN